MGASSSKTAAAAGAAAAAASPSQAAESKLQASYSSIVSIFSKSKLDRGPIRAPQDDLRRELESMKQAMEEQVVSLSEERDKAKEEIRRQGDILAAVQVDRDELSTRVAGMEEQANLLKFSMSQLNRQLSQTVDQASGLKNQLDRRETEKQMLANELAQIKIQHTQTATLLESRTTELKGAQAFLTKADSMSGADIVRMVEGLNAEILQMSAFVADHFEFENPKPYNTNEEVQVASTRLAELVGPKLVDLLATTEHAEDPMIIQFACQAVTATYCRWIVMAWDVEDEGLNHFLQHVYLTIQNAEEQSVAGRWRSITRTHAQRMIHADADVSAILVPHIASFLVDVLLVAGLQASEADIRNVIMGTFEENIAVVVRLALGLNWVTGRDITSADLEPNMILWDTAFHPETMEDAHAEPGLLKPGARDAEVKEDHVLCTTDLGLQRIAKTPRDKNGSGGGDIQTTLLLKPKVVLHSVIEGMEGVKQHITESPASMATDELSPSA